MLELPLDDIKILLALEKKIQNLKQKIFISSQELAKLELEKPAKLEQIELEQSQKIEQEVEKENLVKELVSAKNKEQKEISEIEKIAKSELLQWLKHQKKFVVLDVLDPISLQELPEFVIIQNQSINISQIVKKLIT